MLEPTAMLTDTTSQRPTVCTTQAKIFWGLATCKMGTGDMRGGRGGGSSAPVPWPIPEGSRKDLEVRTATVNRVHLLISSPVMPFFFKLVVRSLFVLALPSASTPRPADYAVFDIPARMRSRHNQMVVFLLIRQLPSGHITP